MDIIKAYPAHKFTATGYYAFDASEDVINYDETDLSTNNGRLALLHEISHAQLGHFNYSCDFELLVMEAQAWHNTKLLCDNFGVKVDLEYIESCIATYDAWLTARSSCPKCGNFNLQSAPDQFSCFICGAQWIASSNPHEKVELRLI